MFPKTIILLALASFSFAISANLTLFSEKAHKGQSVTTLSSQYNFGCVADFFGGFKSFCYTET
jgi:hypothetical protein